jgi:hypothetical protein
LFASPFWFAFEWYGEMTRQIQMPFPDSVAVAAEQYPEHVSPIPFPVAWRHYPPRCGWKLTVLLHALQRKKRTPCFIVLSNDLLRRSGANERDIPLVGLWIPVELQIVLVLLTMQIIDFVPELRAINRQFL